jgi:hypothetical protein
MLEPFFAISGEPWLLNDVETAARTVNEHGQITGLF